MPYLSETGVHRDAWYVIHTNPRKEQQVYRQLCVRAIEAFYPTIRVKPVNPRASKTRSLFPRYLFVRANLEEIGLNKLQWIPGVNRLVQFGGQPASVSDRIVFELKKQLSAIQKAGPLDLNGLKKGDRVRITEGSLAGYEALFDLRLSGEDRVRVLLQLVGRLVKVDINASAIEKI